MSWDIYGNPLRRGHCEVHPHVHEEYPCSVCMAERNRPQINYEDFERLQYEFSQQGDYIRHLESERDALAATVEALRVAGNQVINYGLNANYWVIAVNATPQHHLREVRAEAVLDALSTCAEFATVVTDYHTERHERVEVCFASDIKQYAEQIRRGEVE